MNDKPELILRVINSEMLQGDSSVSGEFDRSGGVIGSAPDAAWCLTDRHGSVLPEHARIEFTDSHFCLRDMQAAVFINDAVTPVGHNRQVLLSRGDTLRIGIYHIGVQISAQRSDHSLEYLTGQRQGDELNDFLAGTDAYQIKSQNKSADPLSVLTSSAEHSFANPTPDNIEQRFLDLPLTRDGLNDGAASAEALIQSLSQGLGQALPAGNEPQQQEMLREMGRMMHATLAGLLKLHAEQKVLADKQLRPIEDNPLRLGLDYAETLALLFSSEKSPVHLSAPAAVSEVLADIRIHHIASQQAISVALQSLLQAFSPGALLERFRHYRRTEEEMTGEEAWYMYQQYFQELTSPRQQGFQRLFRQVYHQVCDRLVREQHREQN